MKSFTNRVRDFVRSEEGPTATEYAVMLALIIIVVISAVAALGTKINGVFTRIVTDMEAKGV